MPPLSQASDEDPVEIPQLKAVSQPKDDYLGTSYMKLKIDNLTNYSKFPVENYD